MMRSGQFCALAMLSAFKQPLPAGWVFHWVSWLRELPIPQLEIAIAVLATAPHDPLVHERLRVVDYVLDIDPTFHARRCAMRARAADSVYAINPLA